MEPHLQTKVPHHHFALNPPLMVESIGALMILDSFEAFGLLRRLHNHQTTKTIKAL
jgi:hypothetical protein